MTELGDETVQVPRARWEAMEARLAELERRLVGSAGTTLGDPGAAESLARTDRRGLLKHGAVLAAGAVAGGAGLALAGAQPAAADTIPSVLAGVNNLTNAATEIESESGTAFIGRCDTSGYYGLYGDDESSGGGCGVYGLSLHGNAVRGENLGSNTLPAVVGSTIGTGPGVQGLVNNSLSTAAAVDAATNGSGPAVSGLTSGTANAVVGTISNPSSSAYAVYGQTNGTGPAIIGQIANTSSSAAAMGGVTNGTGPGFGGLNIGSGPAISGQNWGTGPGILAGVVGATNNQPAISAATAGTGVALQATATGTGSRGGVFAGVAAQAQFKPGSGSTHPTSGQAGDLYVDSSARLWFCKVGGPTATWTQLA